VGGQRPWKTVGRQCPQRVRAVHAAGQGLSHRQDERGDGVPTPAASRRASRPRHGRPTRHSSTCCRNLPRRGAARRHRWRSPGCCRGRPGSCRFRAPPLHRLEENMGASTIELTADELRHIEDALSPSPRSAGDLVRQLACVRQSSSLGGASNPLDCPAPPLMPGAVRDGGV